MWRRVDTAGGRTNRKQQSGEGLEYRQQGRRSEEGDRTGTRESDRGSRRGSRSGRNDRNEQRQDEETTNRRHIHERDPAGTHEYYPDRDQDYRTE